MEDPYAISQQASIREAAALMQEYDVGGLVVTNGKSKLVGLITQRDLFLAPDEELRVQDVMTMPDRIVSVSPDISLDEARAILYEHRLEKLPVLDDEGNLQGFITAQDVTKTTRYP